MSELFGDLEWEDGSNDQPEAPESKKPLSRTWRIARAAAAVAAVVGIGAYVGVEKSAPGQTRQSKLAWQFHERAYGPSDQAEFRFLTDLTPGQVDAGVIENRNALGKRIQNAAARVSLNGLAQGLDNQGIKVDMFDLVEELVKPETQVELQKDGMEFSGLAPVDCDAPAPNGDHGYNPLDYSNHPPSDLKVTTKIENGREITTVPLGMEEMPSTADIFATPIDAWDFYYTYLDKMSFWADEPCVDLYPHQVYPPDDTTYPAGSSYAFSLW